MSTNRSRTSTIEKTPTRRTPRTVQYCLPAIYCRLCLFWHLLVCCSDDSTHNCMFQTRKRSRPQDHGYPSHSQEITTYTSRNGPESVALKHGLMAAKWTLASNGRPQWIEIEQLIKNGNKRRVLGQTSKYRSYFDHL